MKITDRFEIQLEGPDESIHIEDENSQWDVSPMDVDGDVRIDCTHSHGTASIFLRQEELREVIVFLQKQLI
jgi:hypothetical protein